ncbi:phosphopantetheine-binding protein [Neolewinella lacunae]|uniref:Acyl carrier protein n=1 Tax=Neolewinella lacunae TaxID=1517758 RepID=A0A923PTN9_9BACT|nr:phosphopantetheine-binding protein [Neolewinella lacunae]MBC6996622.1 acyl carrier protein [Neolewinella lacunae]MDN3634814.1 phosphopantetheine-binding protein [Neolewinella lacunae]
MSFIDTLKLRIIDELALDVSPDEINADEPLFGGGLGLDSIDGLELVVLLEKYYDIKVGQDEDMQQIFSSVNALANYITQRSAAVA